MTSPGPTCPTCGAAARMPDDAWAALPLVRVMGASEVRPHVTRAVRGPIEIRRCHCGRSVARMARAVPVH